MGERDDDWEGQGGFDLGADPEPPATHGKPVSEPDPMGGRAGKANAAGGLETLWRRFNEAIAKETRFREMCDRFRRRVTAPATDDNDNGDDTK